MQHWKNKVVWISGASSGIGREMAIQSNALGARVVLSARRASILKEVQQQLPHPKNSMVLPLDMEEPQYFQQKHQEITEHFGAVDLLFNNAGMSQRSYSFETPEEVDRKLMEVNYFGNIILSKTVLPEMRRRQQGHLAVVSSLSGKFGFFQRSAYAASKHALHGFFESLRLEEEPNHIHVTLLCPGPVQTNISLNALDHKGKPMQSMDKMQEEGMPVDECVKQMIDAIENRKHEVTIARGKESMAVRLHACLPRLFYKMILKQRPES